MPVNSFDSYPMTWRPKQPQGDKPLYLDIARQLEEDIAAGVLLPGTRLPPQRELADFLDVNISTIVRAFRLCSQKGLLTGAVGSGTYVSYSASANLRFPPQPQRSAQVELGSLNPSETDYSEVIDTIQEMAVPGDIARLMGYGDNRNTLWQKDAAIQLITQAGHPAASTEQLLWANGGQNALAAVLCGLFQPGDRIGTDPLTYPGFKSAAKLLGIRLVAVGQENGEMSEEGLRYACKNEKLKGIYIMPDFQNPTAHTMSDHCRQMLAKVAREENLIIIEDSIFGLFSSHAPKAVASYAPERTVTIASLSKLVLPGLRLAYLIAPPSCRNALDDALYNLNLSVSPFLLELASRLLVSGKAQRIAQAHRQETVVRNRLLKEVLQGYDLHGSEQCMFHWLLLPPGFTSEGFEAAAGRAGVQVYGAHRFAVGNVPPAPACRISVSSPPDRAALRQALEILDQLLKQ